jgi:hypothetical protein
LIRVFTAVNRKDPTMTPDNVTPDQVNQVNADESAVRKEAEDQNSASHPPAEPPLQNRFKAESPKIPGVGELQPKKPGLSSIHLAAIAAVVLLVAALTIYWIASRKGKTNVKASAPAELQLPTETPSPAAAPAPPANTDQVIATVTEMAKPWSSKEFVYRDALSVLTREAILVRLPKGSATQSSGYWAFAMNAAYGNCKLEYLTDMSRLREEYGYRLATHAMVGDPCSRSVIDPLKLSVMPGNIWVRGGIVQGVDVRPPLEIEVVVKGQNIIANRME